MAVLVVVLGFCALLGVALLAYFAGERLRRRQRMELADYVVRRKQVLRHMADLETARMARERRENAAEDVPMPDIPEDAAMTEGLRLIQKVASEAPMVMQSVIKMYVRSDPSAAEVLQNTSRAAAAGR